MHIEIINHHDNWQAIKNAAINTIGAEKGKYPSSEWKSSEIKSRVERGEDYELR